MGLSEKPAHSFSSPRTTSPRAGEANLGLPAARSGKRVESEQDSPPGSQRRWRSSLALTTLGIVYGDIGTSPIYTMNVVFSRKSGIAASDVNVLGVLSLIFWSLLLVVTIKYMLLVLKASNEGDGGVIALATLLNRSLRKRRRRWLLAGVGASALLIGDGMLTPAISVLSAVQGMELISPRLVDLVPVLTAVILVLLFSIQRRGTAAIGGLFGPVMLAWFVCIGAVGLHWVLQLPTITRAMSPTYALHFLSTGGWGAFFVLGSVFLVVTGSEALYADLGHFGIVPIRRTWFWLVWPALILNYFGQGALLLSHPQHPVNTFFALVPSPLLVPLILLAALATLIASQAMITGSYSLLKQLAELGYFPHLRVRHTSALQSGRIYVAAANWLLLGGTLLLVLLFRSSEELASAYGLAIGGVTLITSALYLLYYRQVLGRSRLAAIGLGILFLAVDGTFLAALLAKVLSGALLILVISALLLGIMLTWRWGQDRVRRQRRRLSTPVEVFLSGETATEATRVAGDAIFFSKEPGYLPAGFIQNLRHNKVLHQENYLLYLEVQDHPRVRLEEKLAVEKLGAGFFRVTYRFGYMESPSLSAILSLLDDGGYPVDTESLSVFVSRARFRYRDQKGLAAWRAKIYAFLERNSPGPALVLDIPEDVLIEIGVQFEL